MTRSAEPDMPTSAGVYAVDYRRTPLLAGRVHVERAVHVLTKYGEKDTFVDVWVEEPARRI